MARKLTVYSINPSTQKKQRMAEFILQGSKVKTEFDHAGFEHDILHDGVSLRGKSYRPEDGAKFMDALEQAYSRSSTIVVEN